MSRGLELGLSLGSGGPGRSPAGRNVANALWVRGDSLLQTAGSVIGWVDKFGNWPTGTVPSTAPVYNASVAAYGGKPTASFTNGVAQQVEFATFSLASQPNTIYVVVDDSASNSNCIDGHGATRQLVGKSGADWAFYAGSSVIASSTTSNGPHVICVVQNGASSAMYLDNSQVALVTGNPGAQPIGQLAIGSGSPGAPNQVITGNVAEVLIVPGADSAAQRQQLFAWWAKYYSLVGVA